MNLSKTISAYFDYIDSYTKKAYDVSGRAREKGYDPEPEALGLAGQGPGDIAQADKPQGLTLEPEHGGQGLPPQLGVRIAPATSPHRLDDGE